MSETEQNQDIETQKSLELIKDPELKEICGRILERVKQADIYAEAKELKQKIANAPKQSEQLILAFIPHEMAKVSIFFPMSDKELKEEKRTIQKVEHESSWGKIVVEGIKLAIFEEDIFLVLMKIAREKMKFVNEQYILEINMKEIIHLLYGTSYYSTKKVIDLIIRTLEHFQLVRFELTLFKEQRKQGRLISIGAILQRYDYDPSTQNLKIKFNPDFCAFFLESMLTNINLSIRRKLKKDGSKVLLRFLSTHTNPQPMHILTVLKAINYNVNQPMFRLRDKLREFITELKKNGVLGPKTKTYSNDMVYFDVLPFKKALPE